MKTEDVIEGLAQDARRNGPGKPLPWLFVIGATLLVGSGLMFSIFAVRPDLAAVSGDYGFLLKPLVAALLAAAALRLVIETADPTGRPLRHIGWLGFGLVVLLLGIGIEMMVIPPARWSNRLMGSNPAACALSVFLLALPLLGIVVAAIRQRASVRPILSGAMAGLFSGAVATFLYAAHCPDDSPFFLAVWYGVSVAAVTGLGGLAGRLFLRW
ncbi:NrsF family protein [Notoacmeibacter ruber]|uniref:DUF1109 family protein n=1 Tax=Notoacmeibacter ruber TaxID=2670375 RepID=A0A3L7J9X6_9HYPH|nr:NrsF family protein [Notoacmeibacter ruber]RLQ87558.1 DUF1109 family protein [Notoacmeibacter ruber]